MTLKTTEMACSDLNKYYAALDRCKMRKERERVGEKARRRKEKKRADQRMTSENCNATMIAEKRKEYSFLNHFFYYLRDNIYIYVNSSFTVIFPPLSVAVQSHHGLSHAQDGGNQQDHQGAVDLNIRGQRCEGEEKEDTRLR